ncbi:hypothetical protein Rhow_000450 [Rhodococcus wratislaviensis]|uniref:Uncharacterized protein n=1 Tax=Rhodococcus wratislaviensis TaxID=44752 RepID=A0A402CML1_RHOWR|nr:hypothetical protein Rhow_000450 [Rhodococcus wratislaviensis]
MRCFSYVAPLLRVDCSYALRHLNPTLATSRRNSRTRIEH